jgi:Planctomycete cytochrome C
MNAHQWLVSALGLGLGALAGCGGGSEQVVSFQKDVYPILKTHCLECHIAPDGEGYKASGLAMGTYAALMKGTKNGPIIVAGQSLNSSLNRLIEGRPGVDSSIQMPHGKVKLPEQKLTTIRMWVDQGAKNN